MSLTHLETGHGHTDAYVYGDMVVPGILGTRLDQEDHPAAYATRETEPHVDSVIEVQKAHTGKVVGEIAISSAQS